MTYIIIKYNVSKLSDIDKVVETIYKVCVWLNKRYINKSVYGIINNCTGSDVIDKKASLVIYFKEK